MTTDRSKPGEGVTEEAAKAIYALLPFVEKNGQPAHGEKPAWHECGNSNKQDEARRYARAALEAADRARRDAAPVEPVAREWFLVYNGFRYTVFHELMSAESATPRFGPVVHVREVHPTPAPVESGAAADLIRTLTAQVDSLKKYAERMRVIVARGSRVPSGRSGRFALEFSPRDAEALMALSPENAPSGERK